MIDIGAGICVILMALFVGFIGNAFAIVPNKRVVKGQVSYSEMIREDTRHDIHRTVVSYVVDGNVYSLRCKNLPRSYREGHEIKVMYNAEDPSQAKTCPIPSVFVVMGLLAAVGIAMMLGLLN